MYKEDIDNRYKVNMENLFIKDTKIKSNINLATFCCTHMNEKATKIINQTLKINAINSDVIKIEKMCIDIISKLWNGGDNTNCCGISTVGSSEACMLAGLSMKFLWEENNTDLNLKNKKPNLIISSAHQVCWEKFCNYWDVELRIIPCNKINCKLQIEKLIEAIDEYTIGIIGILGTTYTGLIDDIKKLDESVEKYNCRSSSKVYIHVDAAIGGLYIPFVKNDLVWDFRLKNVISINTSGHKYGMVYPSVGWLIWKDRKYISDKLLYSIDYTGENISNMTLNFSKSASNIIAQYYNFMTLGFKGYMEIHEKTRHIAEFISSEINKTGLFHMYNRGNELPVICYALKENQKLDWDLHSLSTFLMEKNWKVPTYNLSKNLEEIVVNRIVCRSDLTWDDAKKFVSDFKEFIEHKLKS